MRSQVYFPAFQSLFDEPTYARAQSHVEETKDAYLIELDAPGIKREDVKISIEQRHLLIEGERKGKFSTKLKRIFSLPDDVELTKISAQMRDGVLELALPKKEQAKPVSIAVQEAKESFFQKLLSSEE